MAVVINGTTGITAPALDLDTPLPVADGGTGATSNAATGYALKGANSDITSLSGLTTALSAAQGGTGVTSVGTAGNVLTSNGSAWVSQAAGGGAIQTQLFTSPGTWTKPSTVTQVRVTVIGGGGGAGIPGNPGTASSGGTSSFGPLVSATGGGGGRGPATKGGSGSGSITAPATAFFAGQGINNSAFNPTLINVVGGTSIYSNPSQSGVTYTSTLGGVAGAGGVSPAYNASGTCSGGGGGAAIAMVPVAAPVAVTIGTGGSGFFADGGGVSGAVVVEWVG